MAYSEETKLKAVQIANKKSLEVAAEATGVSTRSIQRWQKELSKPTANKEKIIANASTLVARSVLSGALGKQYDGKRDIYEIFGYKKAITFDDYYAKYDRQDIAGRIVDAPAEETWRKPPIVSDDENEDVETEFEKAWNSLTKQTKAYDIMRKADKLSGIGRFGVIVIGAKGSSNLEAAITELESIDDIVYLQAYHEGSIELDTNDIEDDPTSERFGLPNFYKINFGEYEGVKKKDNISYTKVHWSRVIHIAEDTEENEIYGRPRLARIYNRLDDLEKIAGAAPENFFQNAKKDLVARLREGFEGGIDEESLKDELEEYIHGFSNMIKAIGVDIERIQTQISDPSKSFEVIISLISGATGIPKRILLGAERGELASSQDMKNWLAQIENRQKNFAETQILRPFIDRMIQFGILPDVEYTVKWPNLFQQDEQEEAKTIETRVKTFNEAILGAGANLLDIRRLAEQLDLPVVEGEIEEE